MLPESTMWTLALKELVINLGTDMFIRKAGIRDHPFVMQVQTQRA